MNDNLPAIFSDLESDDYHADPALGSSGLKAFMRSPAHYWAAYLDPNRKPRDARHFRVGRSWHCRVFEPEAFGERFATGHDAHPSSKRSTVLASALAGEIRLDQLVALPEGLSKTTKEGKALVAEIEARGEIALDADDVAFVRKWFPLHDGRDVLSADSIDDVDRMAKIARHLPISRVIFEQFGARGHAETSIFATHRASGVRCKIRPDYMLEPCEAFPNGLIVDGKSTTDASEEGFGRQVWNLDYGLQAAWYTRIYWQVMGTRERPAFLWLAQEKESPFAARYYAAGEDLLAHWDARIDEALGAFALCRATGRWAAYPTTVKTLALPEWAQRRIDQAAA